MPPPWPGVDGWLSASRITETTVKTTASSGNASFSKVCTRLCPKKAIAICTIVISSRQGTSAQPVSAERASVPLTEFTANQPTPATSALIPAGRMLPKRPKEMRERIICGTPCSGPRAESTAIASEPRPVPRMIASAAWVKVSPKKSSGSAPTNTVANSKLGEVQVQKRFSGRPCRSPSGMNSAPPGSTAASLVP